MSLKPKTIATLAGLALVGLFAGNAQAQEKSTLSSLLQIIGIAPEDDTPEIDYRERAPLVVPPQMKLRPPEAPPASRTAAWPNDPDVARRKATEAARKVPAGERAERRYSDGQLMKAGEHAGGRTASKQVDETPEFRHPDKSLAGSGWISPDKLRSMGTTKKEETLVAGQEPPRRYLTDPPTGLRTPSDKAPLTAGKSLQKPLLSEKEERDPLNTYRPKPKSEDDE